MIFNYFNLDRIFIKMRTDQRGVGGDEQGERGRKKNGITLCNLRFLCAVAVCV